MHVHVEAEITKGKYHDYDAFLGQEAVDYLKAYLEAMIVESTPYPTFNKSVSYNLQKKMLRRFLSFYSTRMSTLFPASLM